MPVDKKNTDIYKTFRSFGNASLGSKLFNNACCAISKPIVRGKLLLILAKFSGIASSEKNIPEKKIDEIPTKKLTTFPTLYKIINAAAHNPIPMKGIEL